MQVLPNIAHLAEVLDISPFELLPDDIVQVNAATRGRSVPALRKQLLSYRFVNPRYLDDDVAPLPLPELKAAVAETWDAYQARALHFQRKQPEALALLLDAERRAPEQVQRHYMTHSLLHEWLRRRRVTPSTELHGLASRAGILAD
ncbi:hypothetical protein [Cellulomonas sp. ATA003]|uniref:hypothetical protein n=1 Tax=Cellulomonas sp. ATA003 TaxID=3073064 RepID=UPI002873CBF4|nr:hypothetical protein [Cellulomonas sp. ATA003]WNB86685.1 hypothetical protein REH70_05525 [Cellulomonas sp. ATA003]